MKTLCLREPETASHCPAAGPDIQTQRSDELESNPQCKTDQRFDQMHHLHGITAFSKKIRLTRTDNEKHISETRLGSWTIKQRKTDSGCSDCRKQVKGSSEQTGGSISPEERILAMMLTLAFSIKESQGQQRKAPRDEG